MTAREVHPPDLEMQVRIGHEQGRTRLIYTLHSPAGAVPFSFHEVSGPAFAGSPEQFQRHLAARIEQLGAGREADGSLVLREEVDHKLVNLGRDLWTELMPREIQDAYRAIRGKVRSWRIVSSEPWIPWELIKPFDDSRPDDVIDDAFLSLRFALTRWLPGNRTPAQQFAVRRFAVLETAVDLLHPRKERKALKAILRSPCAEDVTPRRHSKATVLLKLLETTDVDLLHLAGHGRPATNGPDESGIAFPDGSVLRPGDLGGPLAVRISRNQPLVFLNACWAGQQGWSLTRLGGWAARWVHVCGCGAFVAPLWPVRDKAALAFAQALYEALARGATLGEAALEARSFVARQRKGDPSALAYTVYGHPNARLRFGEGTSPQAAPRPTRLATGSSVPEGGFADWFHRPWRLLTAFLGAAVLAVVLVTAPFTPPPPDLRTQLVLYLRELDTIDKDWSHRYREVQPLAERVATTLESDFKDVAARISTKNRTATEVRPVANVLRAEIEGVIEQLDTLTSDPP